jgi:hypothetical protein
VLGSATTRHPGVQEGIVFHDPFTSANEAGLAAVVALVAAMAMFSRYRYRVTSLAR